MKFFIPHATTDDLTQQTYNAIKLLAKQTVGWNVSERRIFSIEYKHSGTYHTAQVGRINDTNGEEVFAILESNAYLVCTPNRGVIRGMPILIGTEEIRTVEDFEK